MRILLLIALLLALAACGTTAAYEEVLNSYVGSPESALLAQWGPPDSAYESGGTKYLTYSKSRTVHDPGMPPAYYNTTCSFGSCISTPVGGYAGYTVNLRCKTTFEIQGGTITSWRWQGNACVA